jgi:hypothetical protein
MKILRNMKGANTETKVVYKNVTKIDVVCKKNVAKKNKKRPQSNICTQKIFYCKVEGGGIICNINNDFISSY